jgi:hypothetical protein
MIPATGLDALAICSIQRGLLRGNTHEINLTFCFNAVPCDLLLC